ncbi:MAG: 50S ribosomal protein L23 [bacterium]
MGFLNKTLKSLKFKGKDEEKEAKKKASIIEVEPKKDDKAKDGAKETKKELLKESSSKEAKKESKKELKENTKDAYKVLIKPLISEKAAEAGKMNQYIFIVSKRANKPEIKKAIEAVYGIKPIKVNIINAQGKKVRFGRVYGKRKDWKKAIITLPKGKSIQIYEGI